MTLPVITAWSAFSPTSKSWHLAGAEDIGELPRHQFALHKSFARRPGWPTARRKISEGRVRWAFLTICVAVTTSRGAANWQSPLAVTSNAKYNFCLMDRSCLFLGLRMAVDPTGALATVSSRIAAAGTFGATAYGPVDAYTAFRGGVSDVGLQSIRSIVNRLVTSA